MATALVDAAPQRLGGYARGIADRFRSAAGPADALLGRIVATEPEATTLEIAGLDPLAGPTRVRLPTAGSPQRRERARRGRRRRRRRRRRRARSRAGLAGFGGVGRRLERKGEAGGVAVYDDYGHHPTAIRETLAAVRQREPGRRVWAVYEPLTYHRTAALLDAFADALAAADAVAIADIWAGPRPGHVDQLGGRPGRGGRRPQPSHPRRGARERRGDRRLARGRGPARRRRAGDGRRPLATASASCCSSTWRHDDDRVSAGASTCWRRTRRRARATTATPTSTCSPTRPSSCSTRSSPPLAGHNALRAYLLEAADAERHYDLAIERHWVSGETVLAAWHASWNRVGDEAKVRQAGFLSAEMGEDGRIGRLRLWTVAREHLAG